MCQKIPYKSLDEAADAVEVLRDKLDDGITLNAYHCKKCGLFHVGNKKINTRTHKINRKVLKARRASKGRVT